MKQAKPIRASLPHLAYLPSSVEGKSPAIIAMHGRGTDENDLVPLVFSLELQDIMIVAPRAPFAFSYGGYAWYNLGQEGVPERETFQTSFNLLRKFIGEVKVGYPIDSERIVLLGFSQGTVMAYATALTDPPAFHGITALSGYIPQRSGLQLQLRNLTGFPVFISHAFNDPVIPVRLGREAKEILAEAGADVTYREYPMGHQVSEETLSDLKQWMKKILATG